MDTRGRTIVAVPVVLSVGIGCLLLPLAQSVAAVTAVVALIVVGALALGGAAWVGTWVHRADLARRGSAVSRP